MLRLERMFLGSVSSGRPLPSTLAGSDFGDAGAAESPDSTGAAGQFPAGGVELQPAIRRQEEREQSVFRGTTRCGWWITG